MITTKSHHVLGNDGEDIVVLGLASSIHFLSTTPLIQGDGTFTCVVHPYTQLYVFHALVRNGVSYPVLYCLVKGKNQAMYQRLLRLVEQIARDRNVTILQRPVRLIVDFEKAFHNAAFPTQQEGTCRVVSFIMFPTLKREPDPSLMLSGKGLGEVPRR